MHTGLDTRLIEPQRLLDQVLERDLDVVLMSALFASKPFRAFMLRSAIDWTGDHSFMAVRVSDSATSGETDLLVVVDLDCGDRLGLMIEHKINAIFQPLQAERYRERGMQGIREGRWTRFATCLCAPEGYIAGARAANEWDAYLSLESISQWATSSGDKHLAFVAAVCTQAVKKQNFSLRQKSPKATEFWRAYRRLAAKVLPDICITRLADAVSDTLIWPEFGSGLLPPAMNLEHKAQNGRVDLTFHEMSVPTLRSLQHAELPPDVSFEKAGKSAALRIVVPRIDHLRAFDEQQEEVLAAFVAVERLLAIGREITASIPISSNFPRENSRSIGSRLHFDERLLRGRERANTTCRERMTGSHSRLATADCAALICPTRWIGDDLRPAGRIGQGVARMLRCC